MIEFSPYPTSSLSLGNHSRGGHPCVLGQIRSDEVFSSWGCKQTSYWMKWESLYYGATVQPLNSASISVNLDSRELLQWAWRTTRPWQYLTRFQKDGARSQQCIYGATCWDPPDYLVSTGNRHYLCHPLTNTTRILKKNSLSRRQGFCMWRWLVRGNRQTWIVLLFQSAGSDRILRLSSGFDKLLQVVQ